MTKIVHDTRKKPIRDKRIGFFMAITLISHNLI